jgi:hypothetical protein
LKKYAKPNQKVKVVRYNREFVITVIVITEFDCTFLILNRKIPLPWFKEINLESISLDHTIVGFYCPQNAFVNGKWQLSLKNARLLFKRVCILKQDSFIQSIFSLDAISIFSPFFGQQPLTNRGFKYL